MNYDNTDKMMKIIDKYIVKEFNSFTISGFDDLHYIKKCATMYNRIRKKVVNYLLDLLEKDYLDSGGDIDFLDDLHDMFLTMLEKPNLTTGYSFNNEFERKASRLAEELEVSVNEQESIDKAKRILSRMVGEYADITTITAYIESYKSQDIAEVIWHSQPDDRVCNTCGKLNNKVYSINELPMLPQHWGCRCWIEPID